MDLSDIGESVSDLILMISGRGNPIFCGNDLNIAVTTKNNKDYSQTIFIQNISEMTTDDKMLYLFNYVA